MRELYEELTRERPLRADELVYAAAEHVPDLPTREQVAAERELLQKDKQGLEIAQGAFLGDVLADPVCGRHLIDAMLRPTQLALDHLDELQDHRPRRPRDSARSSGAASVGIVELRNPRHLNAEDDTTTGPLEAAIDLVLLDPEIEIGVLRGGVVEHERYAGRRIFGAGLNLTHLYRGQISYLFFPVRDLGLVHKVFRGLSEPRGREAVDRRRRDVRDRRRLPAAADRRPHPRRGGLPLHAAGAQRGDHPRRREPAAAAVRRRPPRAPGDPLRRRAGAGGAGRRDRGSGRDGRRDRAPRGRPAERRRGQRRRQPARVADRPGADRDVPRVHVGLLSRNRPSATSARR